MKHYLAIDIGASSGRGIIGFKENDQIQLEEIYRFDNGTIQKDNRLYWDVDYLFEQIIICINKAQENYDIESLSIDTWGVDYVLMNNDTEILPVYAYRDPIRNEIYKKVHEIIKFEDLYKKTGCQFQPFNTIYQLYDDKLNHRLDKATDYLMMPEYFIYKLTGVKVNEYTNASTTGLLNANSKEIDLDIIRKLDIKETIFKKLTQPKTFVGYLKEDVLKRVKKQVKVVLCATHDTASAVEAIPLKSNQIYISSGTWALLGVKTETALTDEKSMITNYSNEGGINYNRYQKNIMGNWVINELKNQLDKDKSFNEITNMAKNSNFNEIVDINHQDFLSPVSMKDTFDAHLKTKPQSNSDYYRCAYLSLANSFNQAILELQENTHKNYDQIYIVGGGAKNEFLNKLTEQFTNIEVIALPIEATSLGNIKVQMEVDE